MDKRFYFCYYISNKKQGGIENGGTKGHSRACRRKGKNHSQNERDRHYRKRHALGIQGVCGLCLKLYRGHARRGEQPFRRAVLGGDDNRREAGRKAAGQKAPAGLRQDRIPQLDDSRGYRALRGHHLAC